MVDGGRAVAGPWSGQSSGTPGEMERRGEERGQSVKPELLPYFLHTRALLLLSAALITFSVD